LTQILIRPTHPKATVSNTDGWACTHTTPEDATLGDVTLCPDCHDLLTSFGGDDDDPVLVDSAGRVRVRWATA
jgi:hypothetical protein